MSHLIGRHSAVQLRPPTYILLQGRSTLSMSKIKVRISETKYLSFYKSLANLLKKFVNFLAFLNSETSFVLLSGKIKMRKWSSSNLFQIFRPKCQDYDVVKLTESPNRKYQIRIVDVGSH